MKEWLYKKSALRRGELGDKNQEEFLLEAIKYKDIEGVELALKHNLNLEAFNNKGKLIWFDIAREAFKQQDEFALKALILLISSQGGSEENIIYQRSGANDISFIALCGEEKLESSYIHSCNLDHRLAKITYHRYSKDLQKFAFEGDLQLFAALGIYLYCDGRALHSAHAHGLKFEETFPGEENILHIIATTVEKFDTELKAHPNNILTKARLEQCIELMSPYSKPLLLSKVNDAGKLPKDLTSNSIFQERLNLVSETIMPILGITHQVDREISKLEQELDSFMLEISELFEIYVSADESQDLEIEQIQAQHLWGMEHEAASQ